MSATAEPLYALTNKVTEWVWTEACERSYQALKEQLISKPHLLAFPDWKIPFYVETDASSIAVGAVLSQDDKTGTRRVLEFSSSKLNKAQLKYLAGELETYAVVAVLWKWKVYLQAASKVILVTDHHPLKWLRQQRDPRNKYARWILEFDPVNYEIQYRKGRENGAADYLSRMPGDVGEGLDDEESFERNVYLIEQKVDVLREGLKKGQLKD